MKNLIFILIVLLITAGCNTPKSIMGLLKQSEFSEIEKRDIVKLVDFFESQITVEGKIKKESYENLITDIYEDYNSITNKISIEEQRKVFDDINSSTFKNIWLEGEGKIYVTFDGKKLKEPIKYKGIGMSTEGKYVELLKRLGKDNEKINQYYNSLVELGDIPLYIDLYGKLIDLNAKWTEDVEQSQWRLIIAIHILTINEQQNRYMSIKEN